MTQLVASVISIHVPALPDPYCLSSESASLVRLSINRLDILPVYYIIFIAYVIHGCRFVAYSCCPCHKRGNMDQEEQAHELTTEATN